jgi:hypothetical protein
MATELAEARTAIYNALDAIAGLRASKYPPDQVNTPLAFVGGVREQFHESFEGGSQMTVEVVLLAADPSREKLQACYAKCEPYLAKSGASSIYAAIEAVGGCWVTSVDDSAVEYAGAVYVGATFVCGVMA